MISGVSAVGPPSRRGGTGTLRAMDPSGLFPALFASLVFFGVILATRRRLGEPAYWPISWALLLAIGLAMASAPGPLLHAAARFAATLFVGLQLAGAYAYAGRPVPAWVLPASAAGGVARVCVAALGVPEASHAAVVPLEVGMLGWGAVVVLRRDEGRRHSMDGLLALGAVALCGLQGLDAIVDLHFPGGAVVWAPWLAVSPIIGVLQLVAAGERFQRGALEERLAREERRHTHQRLESLGVLARGVAHDLNNHLTSIVGNIDLALEELPRGHPAREHLADSLRGARQAGQLSEQMDAYARGRPLFAESVDLAALVASREALLRAALPGDVALHVEAPAAIPRVSADAAQIEQALVNLVVNAGEACSGGGEVGVEVDRAEAGGGAGQPTLGELSDERRYLRLRIWDTGAGMDEPQRRRLFDPFYTTKLGRRGLGLSVTQRIVLAHGGALCVDSEPGRGTRIDVYLPTPDKADEADVATAQEDPPCPTSS